MKHTTSFDDLPEESKLDIFSRLPLELVLDCRKVCKPWRNILQFQRNSTVFAHEHLLHHRRRQGLEKYQKRLADANDDEHHCGCGRVLEKHQKRLADANHNEHHECRCHQVSEKYQKRLVDAIANLDEYHRGHPEFEKYKKRLLDANQNKHQCRCHQVLEKHQKRQLVDANHDEDDISHDGSDSSTMSLFVFDGKKFYYGEHYDAGSGFVGYKTRKINLEFPADVCGFVGSCDGLVCLSVEMKCQSIIKLLSNPGDGYIPEGFYRKNDQPVYICNPVTREIVTLPALCIKNKKDTITVAHGFGFHPLTKEYKVVRIWYGSTGSNSGVSGQVEVYTLGSGRGWRNAGKLDYYVVPNDENGNNCVNGSLHWLKYGTGEIVAFDLADEEFHFVHTPPGSSSNTSPVLSSRIFVMRGCLCLSYEYANVADLWMLKKNNETNAGSSNLCDAKHQYYKSRTWIRESRIRVPPYVNRAHKIVGLSQEGDMVLKHIDGSLCQRNTKRGCSKRYLTVRNNKEFYFRIISHMNSFISLKALGEANVSTCIGSRDADDDEVIN